MRSGSDVRKVQLSKRLNQPGLSITIKYHFKRSGMSVLQARLLHAVHTRTQTQTRTHKKERDILVELAVGGGMQFGKVKLKRLTL